jgi:hypothetical protein
LDELLTLSDPALYLRDYGHINRDREAIAFSTPARVYSGGGAFRLSGFLG